MTTRRRILLVGTDRYVLDACRSRDLEVVLVRGYHSIDAGQVDVPADVIVVAVEDQRNPESVLGALIREGLTDRPFDAVQTTNEQSLVTTSVLGQLLGHTTITPETAVRFRDKWLQKEVIRRAGIATARSTFVADIRSLLTAEEMPYRRAVLKPAAGAATALTAVVDGAAQLSKTATDFIAQSPGTRQYVLEEFIDGEEWLVDGLVSAGQVRFASVAIYGRPCLTAITSGVLQRTRRFDPTEDAPAFQAAMPVVQRALTALGLTDGVFHMELFDTDGDLTFSECAARRGGGLIQEEVLHKFGVNLADAAVGLALGEEPELHLATVNGVVGTTFLSGPGGVLVSCPTPGEVCARTGVEFARIETPRGVVIRESAADTNTRVGIALVSAESKEQLDRRMIELTQWFADACQTIPAGLSTGELRRWQSETWPHLDFDGGLYDPDRQTLSCSFDGRAEGR